MFSLNHPAGTVLRERFGPLTDPVFGMRKNKRDGTTNAAYTLTVRGTGTARLSGTNDIGMYGAGDGPNAMFTLEPKANGDATWTPICTQAGTGSAAASNTTNYAMIRLTVETQGTGTVQQASVLWD